MSFSDPLFDGIKVIVMPHDRYAVKCMRACRMNGSRLSTRVDGIEAAREWAIKHRSQFASHDEKETTC